MKFFALVFSIFLLTNLSTFAQESDSGVKTGSITGVVKSRTTQKPLPGLTVRVLDSKFGDIADKNGEFEIKNVPVGTYAVQFSYIGYQTYVQSDVIVNTARPVFLEIELAEKIIELEEAEVRSQYFVKRVEAATSAQTLSAEDIRRTPGAQEDVIRATALLPGVSATQAGRNDLVVRGGAPFENLFVVDNIEVPNINHFGTQGTSGGPLSIVNIDLIKSVDFSSGGFSPEYGDKVSSITKIKLRKGNRDEFIGEANLSATGFGVRGEGPISGAGSYILNVRRSYLDFVFDAAGFSFIPEYWDFTGKTDFRIDSKNSLSFLTIGAIGSVKLNNDNLDNRYDNSRIVVPEQHQYFTGLTWQTLLKNGFADFTFGRTFTHFDTYQNDSTLNEVFKNISAEGINMLKADFDLQLAKKMELAFGTEFKFASTLDYDVFIPDSLRLDASGVGRELKVDTSLSAFMNSNYGALTFGFGRSKATVGLRTDYYGFLENKLKFSPRISYLFRINDVSAIGASLGRYYQRPSFIWLIGGSEEVPSAIRADQVALSFDHTPTQDVKVQVEVYYKQYGDYPARVWRPQAVLSPSGFDDISSDIPFGLEPLESVGEGWSRGFEIFIQKKLSSLPFYGLFSFSLSETKFKGLEDKFRYGAYDTRAILNIGGGYRIEPNWEFSGKFRLATGRPTTPFFTTGPSIGRLNYEEYNEGERLPVFHALDLRVDKRWNFKAIALTTYIDVQNVYGRENVNAIQWDYRNMEPLLQKSIGVLPSFGVRIEF